MKRSFGVMLFFLSLFLAACNDQAEQNREELLGYWTVEKAFREKRETSLLSGVFFEFKGNGFMTTNLPNAGELPSPFVCKSDQIVQQLEPPLVYKIQQLEDSVLVLVFEMNNTMFELHLRKNLPANGVPESTPQQQ